VRAGEHAPVVWRIFGQHGKRLLDRLRRVIAERGGFHAWKTVNLGLIQNNQPHPEERALARVSKDGRVRPCRFAILRDRRPKRAASSGSGWLLLPAGDN